MYMYADANDITIMVTNFLPCLQMFCILRNIVHDHTRNHSLKNDKLTPFIFQIGRHLLVS